MCSRSWVSCLLCTVFVYAAIKWQGAYGKCNCVFTLEGDTYNITSLESTDDTARFTVEHQGYIYSYNPCRSFHFVKDPPFGDCQEDMAMCWWIKDLMYRKIAEQSTAKCDFNERYKMPMIHYTGDGYIRKTTVLLKCNRTNEQANFEVVDTSGAGEFVFKLTHKCACPNACVISPPGHSSKDPTSMAVATAKHTSKDPTATDSPSDLDNIVVPVVASGAGVLGLVIATFAIWKLLCKQNNNDREQLLNGNNEGEVDESKNHFCSPSGGSESTRETGSASLSKPPPSSNITVHDKGNLNSEIKVSLEDIRC